MLDKTTEEVYSPGDIKEDVEGRRWLKLSNGSWALIIEDEEQSSTTKH